MKSSDYYIKFQKLFIFTPAKYTLTILFLSNKKSIN